MSLTERDPRDRRLHTLPPGAPDQPNGSDASVTWLTSWRLGFALQSRGQMVNSLGLDGTGDPGSAYFCAEDDSP